MRWIKEHRLFSSIIAIVAALILLVIIFYLSGGGATFIGSGIRKGITSVSKPLTNFSHNVSRTMDGIFNHKKIQKENEKLKRENARLKQKNIDLAFKRNELEELKKLSSVFNFQPFQGRKKAVAAGITAIDKSLVYNIFTVDTGTEKGIKKGSVVVDEKGLVGKVEATGKGWSKIVTILDTEQKISFYVKRKPSIKGVIKGGDDGKLTGYLIDDRARIIEGDQLITSGFGKYPTGIYIGKVVSVDFDSDTQLKVIRAKTATNLKSIRKVAIFI